MRSRNYYDLLGVIPDATQEEIRNSYRIRVRVLHPDRFDPITQKSEWEKATEMSSELNEAYAVLRDSVKRSQYDKEMGFHRSASSSGATQSQPRAREHQTEQPSQRQHRESTKPPPAHEQQQPRSTAPARTGAVHLRFSISPTSVKERLLERKKGNGEHLSWRTKTLWLELGCLALGALWIGALFYSADDYRWKDNQPITFGLLSIAGAFAISFGVIGLWRWKNSPLKGYVFVTPLYFIKVRFDDVWYWGLWQIADLSSTNHYTNGVYSYTTVNFIFDEGKESLKVKSIASAQHLFDRLRTWSIRRNEEAKRSNWEYFAGHDDFIEVHGNEPRESPGRKIV